MAPSSPSTEAGSPDEQSIADNPLVILLPTPYVPAFSLWLPGAFR